MSTQAPFRKSRSGLWLVLPLLLLASGARAQQGPDNEPAAAQGYVNNAFHSSSFDSINAFNGQLTIPIPVGPSYPVGPSLKFQAQLTYNTKVWEYGRPFNNPNINYIPVYGNPALGIGWTFTIGKIGWCGGSAFGVCYFGPDGSETVFMVDPQNPNYLITQDASQLRLFPASVSGPYTMWDGDGNEYLFNWSVTGYDDPQNANYGYIRDYGRGRNGWYLRNLKDRFNNQIQIDYQSAVTPCQYTGLTCDATYLTTMRCNGTNSWIPQFVRAQPAGAAAQQVLEVVIDPSTKMIKSLNFKWHPDSVQSAQTAVWSLDYATVTLDRGSPNCLTTVLQTLSAIHLPGDIAGTPGYRFDYFNLGGYQGLIKKMTLPTDAEVRYDYGRYHFYQGRPSTIEAGSSCGISSPPLQAAVVKSRIQTEGGNAPIEAPASAAACQPGDPREYSQSQAGVVRRTVTGPGLEAVATDHTDYTQYSMPFGETGVTGGAQTLTVIVRPADIDGRRRAEAILFWAGTGDPKVPSHPGDQTGAELRRAVYDYDPNQGVPEFFIQIPLCSGNASELCPNKAVRVTQRVFSYSAGDINRRLSRERTYYGAITNTDGQVDDYCPACPQHTVKYHIDPDPLAPDDPEGWEDNGRHYTFETHWGTLSAPDGSDARTVQTVWDPKATASVWLRNLYTRRTTTQGTAIDEKFEFDSNLGFLKGSSTGIYDPVPSHVRLVYLTCRYKNTDGTLGQYFSARYPAVSEPSTTACTDTYVNPPTSTIGTNGDAFGKIYTYDAGHLKTAQWINGGAPVTWNAERYDRAPTSQVPLTGWILKRYDTADLSTAYVYDSLGRVTSIAPPGETATTIVYVSPTQTVVTRGSSTRLEYFYDSLGRLIRERRRVAGGGFVKRFRKYDPAGHEYFQSEWVTDAEVETLNRDQSETCAVANDPTPVTSYPGLRPSLAPGTFRGCFDPFGRPREIIGSKTSSHLRINRNDGSNWYTDTLESVTTLCVNGIWSSGACSGGLSPDPITITRRDAFGRVTKVVEPDSASTSYAYDANDKVIQVLQGVQTRSFTYDVAGFLRSENTPEKGLVTYNDYGSLGNVLLQTESNGGSNDLMRATCYDFAGRLKEVRTNEGAVVPPSCPPTAAGRLYVQNTYDGSGNGRGKLLQRIGFNPSSPSVPQITETFTYSGLGGRLSSKNSTVTGTPPPPQTLGTINEQWTYNTLGLLSTHQLPKRTGDSVLTATFSYLEGLVTGITEGPNTLVSNVTYHPHGGISQWTAGSGTTTTILADPSFLSRPLQITSTGLATGSYAYDGAGNIKSIGQNPAKDQFDYDSRSRLKQSTVWNQGISSTLSYLYDQYGNLNPNGVNPVTAGNNRLTNGVYDGRGNLTSYSSQRYAYDGLSRQTALNGGFERYLYDGAGERIARLTAPSTGAKLYTVTPCRLLDTRSNGPSIGAPRVVQATGWCGVPLDATGLVGNLVALPPASPPTGLLNIYATETNPATSTLNFNANQTRANNFQLGISGNGQVTLVASSTVDAIVDVVGYFKVADPLWTMTFRDEANRLSSEYTFSSTLAPSRVKSYFYLGNLLVATRNSAGGYTYYASDHLGTPRATTGALTETHKYQPFGTQITSSFGNQPLKFASMERDGSSGNDFDHARYQSSLLGRFLSPDRISGEPKDPQSWNRYAYAKSNPLLYVDPTGEAVELIGETDEERRRALALLQSSVGKAGSRLYINEDHFVGIQGSVAEFNKLSSTARGLSSLIGDKSVVEFGLTSRDLSRLGGAATYEPGESGNQNTRVLINPDQVDTTNRILNPNALMGWTHFAGWNQDPRWTVNAFTAQINTWHEFGHAWGLIHGKSMGTTNPDALRWENRMRQFLYGPLGPSNAPRVVH